MLHKKVAIAFSLILISFLLVCQKVRVDEYATISFMIGDVSLNNMDATINAIVRESDVIKTGKSSFCDIKIGQSIIRIKEKSIVTFSELFHKNGLEKTSLAMNIGKVLCKPKKLLKSERFLVKTPTAVAGVRGTKFVVQADKRKNTMIKVFGGKVKIAKRIKAFDDRTDKIMEVASVLAKQQKAVITKKDVDKSERRVARILKYKKKVDLDVVIKQARYNVIVGKADIQKFTAKDYLKDQREIIAIKRKPAPIINLIVRTIYKEKKKPKPDGVILITKFDVYFIKNGSVRWEGKVVNAPIEKDGRLFIASGDYVFCAKKDGQVQWRKNIKNDGKLSIKDKKLMLKVKGKDVKLDLDTGEKL